MTQVDILPPEKPRGRKRKAQPDPIVNDAVVVEEAEAGKRGPGRPPKRTPVQEVPSPEEKRHGAQPTSWRSRRYCADYFDVAPGTWDRWVRENRILLKPTVINGTLRRWTDQQLDALAERED